MLPDLIVSGGGGWFQVNDSLLWTIGMYRFPTLAFYGGQYPTGELLAAVKVEPAGKPAASASPAIELPAEVAMALGLHPPPAGSGGDGWVGLGAAAVDFFWVCWDCIDIVAAHGRTINVAHHPWAFPDAQPGKRSQGLCPMGAFAFDGSLVGPVRAGPIPIRTVHLLPPTQAFPPKPRGCPIGREGRGLPAAGLRVPWHRAQVEPKADLAFGCLDPLRVSIHAQKGGMCCSPNNAKMTLLQPGHGGGAAAAVGAATPGLAYVWTAAVGAATACTLAPLLHCCGTYLDRHYGSRAWAAAG